MSNNAGNTAVQAVTPVVNETKEKMVQVPVTVIEGKEVAAILTVDTEKYIKQALELALGDEQTQKTLLEQAAKNILKAACNQSVARWKNLVSKMADLPKYRNTHTHEQVEAIYRDNVKTKHLYKAAQDAAKIKANLDTL